MVKGVKKSLWCRLCRSPETGSALFVSYELTGFLYTDASLLYCCGFLTT